MQINMQIMVCDATFRSAVLAENLRAAMDSGYLFPRERQVTFDCSKNCSIFQ